MLKDKVVPVFEHTAATPFMVDAAGVPIQTGAGVPLNSSAPISGAVPAPP